MGLIKVGSHPKEPYVAARKLEQLEGLMRKPDKVKGFWSLLSLTSPQ
jgi:hypothetical protein